MVVMPLPMSSAASHQLAQPSQLVRSMRCPVNSTMFVVMMLIRMESFLLIGRGRYSTQRCPLLSPWASMVPVLEGSGDVLRPMCPAVYPLGRGGYPGGQLPFGWDALIEGELQPLEQ